MQKKLMTVNKVINLLCHSSFEFNVDCKRLGRFSHEHSSLIALTINCSSIVVGTCSILTLNQLNSSTDASIELIEADHAIANFRKFSNESENLQILNHTECIESRLKCV